MRDNMDKNGNLERTFATHQLRSLHSLNSSWTAPEE